MIQKSIVETLRVRSALRAGAIVCFDDSYGYLLPVWTPCSTGSYFPSNPPDPGIQWLTSNYCEPI